MDTNQFMDRCSVCGAPFKDTGKKQQCRNCGMFANLCCDPQWPIEERPKDGVALQDRERNAAEPARKVRE